MHNTILPRGKNRREYSNPPGCRETRLNANPLRWRDLAPTVDSEGSTGYPVTDRDRGGMLSMIGTQLEFPVWDRATLETRLSELVGERLELTFTNNASTMMSYRPPQGRIPGKLRLHRMFESAPPEVLEALAHWVNGRRRTTAGRTVDQFIESRRHLIDRRIRLERQLRTGGRHHDLRALLDAVNAEHFERTVDARITWGRLPSVRAKRSIRLGSYSSEENLIRVHPHLDQAFVPEYFVRYIVFHEMLHAFLGYELTPTGRRRVHTREFYRLERAYPDYARAMAWHDHPGNLARVMRPRARSA